MSHKIVKYSINACRFVILERHGYYKMANWYLLGTEYWIYVHTINIVLNA